MAFDNMDGMLLVVGGSNISTRSLQARIKIQHLVRPIRP